MSETALLAEWACNSCGKLYPTEVECAACPCPKHTPIMHSQRPYKTKRFAQLMAEGFFYCTGCECITELRDTEEVQHHCGLCGSPRVRWVEPVKL